MNKPNDHSQGAYSTHGKEHLLRKLSKEEIEDFTEQRQAQRYYNSVYDYISKNG